MKRLLKTIIFSSMMCLFLLLAISCGKENKWSYSKGDAGKFYALNASLVKDDSSDLKLTFVLTATDDVFKSKISTSNIVVYEYSSIDFTKVDGYLGYNDIKDYAVDVDSATVNTSRDLEVVFEGEYGNTYGVLINKKGLSIDTHAYAIAMVTDIGAKIETDFEEQVIKTRGSWELGGALINMGSYVSQIVIGGLTDNPCAIASGFFGLFNLMGNIGYSTGNSIDTVTNQLNVIDKKIDEINAKIDANQKQIVDEFIRTQAMIDEVKINQYNKNISDFHTLYVRPMDEFLLNYKDQYETALKNVIKEGNKTITVYYGGPDLQTYEILYPSQDNMSQARQTFTYTITSFDNAKKYLDEHKNAINKDFYTELRKDIFNYMSQSPSSRWEGQVADDIYLTLVDELNQSIVTQENESFHEKVLKLANDFIYYTKIIAGTSFESILNSYIQRLMCMYNYAGEIKSHVRDLLASIKLSLDAYFSSVQDACLGQDINYIQEIGAAYESACDAIKAVYESQMAIEDNYSFITKNLVKVDLFNNRCNVYYTNPGNYPTIHASFKLYKNVSYDGKSLISEEGNINDYEILDYSVLKAMQTRYTLLRGSGDTVDLTFIEYLATCKVADSEDIKSLEQLEKAYYTNSRRGRFLTTFSTDTLSDSDTHTFVCVAAGNPKGSYFSIGKTYRYRHDNGDIESKYWSGRYAYGDMYDATNMAKEDASFICAYARYDESHALWINDEHWGLIDNLIGSFQYIMFVPETKYQ